MRFAIHLLFPVVCAVYFLWWSLNIFEASSAIELMLCGSLILAVAVAAQLMKLLPVNLFFLVLLGSMMLFIIWSLFWAASEELYIYFFVEDGTANDGAGPGRSRYIYPGHSGMGSADGFLRYLANLPYILVAGAAIGALWGAILGGIHKLREPALPNKRLHDNP